ncbi:uracil-DNA glycosylase [Bdellovibrio bacteriovorus W]|nr:uracil-DNA glycosylase [Bdellovibrio bacteriovorus W]
MRPEKYLNSDWKKKLDAEFNSQYYQDLSRRLSQRQEAGAVIFPPENEIFQALNRTPFDNVKVVIVGQDPYHGNGQAEGLSFSVKAGVRFPPSLRNILKELHADTGEEIPLSGSLMKWAEQGVLLLNAVLTVEEAQANSHQGWGWEQLTDRIIDLINEEKNHVVFLLWGSYAQRKGRRIDRQKHLVIEEVHPSPLSAHRGFAGSQPFSKINSYLRENGQSEISWKLT